MDQKKVTSVKGLDYTRVMRQGLTTNLFSWQGNVDYRKSALDYTTLGRAFRKNFLLKKIPFLFINTMIMKTISSCC